MIKVFLAIGLLAFLFAKGLEVVGRGENNYSIEYKGPKKIHRTKMARRLWLAEREKRQ